MMNYIFKQLNQNEENFKRVNKIFRKQRRFNNQITWWAVLTTVYIALDENHIKNMRCRIEHLENEIEKLTAEKECKQCDD